jgi:putative transposase
MCTAPWWAVYFFMGRIVPVEYAKRAKYQPPAMRVRDGCYTKKSPFRYNEVVQAYHNERKGDFNG